MIREGVTKSGNDAWTSYLSFKNCNPISQEVIFSLWRRNRLTRSPLNHREQRIEGDRAVIVRIGFCKQPVNGVLIELWESLRIMNHCQNCVEAGQGIGDSAKII